MGWRPLSGYQKDCEGWTPAAPALNTLPDTIGFIMFASPGEKEGDLQTPRFELMSATLYRRRQVMSKVQQGMAELSREFLNDGT